MDGEEEGIGVVVAVGEVRREGGEGVGVREAVREKQRG